MLRVVHNTNNLEAVALYLYRDWLPASGEEARDFPIYCQRHFSSFPNVPVHEVIVELFLPLEIAPLDGAVPSNHLPSLASLGHFDYILIGLIEGDKHGNRDEGIDRARPLGARGKG